MIITQRQGQRRDRLSNLAYLRRFVGLSYHLANLRAVLLLGLLLLALASDYSALAILCMVPAILGGLLHYLALATGFYDSPNWLLRRYEAHLVRTQNLPRLPLAAVFEAWGAIALVALVGGVITDLEADLRLLALVLAVAHMCTVSYAIFDDAAWYNPGVRSPRWQEVARIVSGPQIVALVLLVGALGAPWASGSYLAIVIIAAYGLSVPILLMANQFLTSGLRSFVERERQRGTSFVIDQTRLLLGPLAEAQRLAMELGEAPIATLTASAIASVRDIPQHVVRADQPTELTPLATVADRMAVLVESAGATISSYVPSDLRLSEADRTLAGTIVRDLIGNAINARARHIGLTVTAAGSRLLVVVTDDGIAMPKGAWRAPGTSSALLAARLRERDGWLRVDESADQTKAVAANWLQSS